MKQRQSNELPIMLDVVNVTRASFFRASYSFLHVEFPPQAFSWISGCLMTVAVQLDSCSQHHTKFILIV